jgi:hypothetical protein
MLELGRITAMHRDSRAIHMKLSYNATTPFRSFRPHELRTERALLRALPQPQKTNEDILLGVFVRKEGLPTSVRGVVASEQLYRFGSNFVMDFVDL